MLHAQVYSIIAANNYKARQLDIALSYIECSGNWETEQRDVGHREADWLTPGSYFFPTGSSVYPRVEKVVCEVGSLAQPIEKDSSLSNFSPI